jgi:hypothetical protein
MRAARLSVILFAACAHRIPVHVGPPALDAEPGVVYSSYLAGLPRTFKMRHQVATRFGPREEVLEGFLVGERPARFWVRAMGPLGGTLFDVKSIDGELRVDVKLEQLDDPNAPRYLAADIRRIYFQDCPAGGPVERRGDTVVATCSLAGTGPDDHLESILTLGGVVLEKRFHKNGESTVAVTYEDYREVGGAWLPHRIHLAAAKLPYELTIALLKVEIGVDTSAAFGGS